MAQGVGPEFKQPVEKKKIIIILGLIFLFLQRMTLGF
jgi:hypothetical protein